MDGIMVFREILRLGKPCKCRLAVEGEKILQKHVDLWVNATAKQMKGLIIFSKMSQIRSDHCGRSRKIPFFNERKLYRINGRRQKQINVLQTVIPSWPSSILFCRERLFWGSEAISRPSLPSNTVGQECNGVYFSWEGQEKVVKFFIKLLGFSN